MTRDSPRDVEVTGGVTGFEVRADDLRLAARVLADVGADVGAVGAAVGLAVADDLLAASSVLDPAGAAGVAAALAAALAGPSGVLTGAAALELQAGRLAVAAARYSSAEEVAGRARDTRRWLQGAVGLLALPALAGAAAAWAVGTAATGGDPVAEAEQFLLTHPGVVDELTGSAPGAASVLVVGLAGPLVAPADAVLRLTTDRSLLPGSLVESAGLLALLYREGRARVERVDAAPARPPADLGDVLLDLAAADERARGEREGLVVVTRLVVREGDGDERVSHVVHLPGTKDWQVDPRTRDGVNDLATNLELMAGEPNARVEAVRVALERAGARPEEPVLLVGHSQGGMVALRAADELAGRYSVTHVVTAGSPVGRMPVPDGVQVLSLENRQDPVPRLDAAPNRTSSGHVTVAFDADLPPLGDEHSLTGVYLPAARALAHSREPALQEWLATAGAFLPGTDQAVTATATSFVVTNETDPP